MKVPVYIALALALTPALAQDAAQSPQAAAAAARQGAPDAGETPAVAKTAPAQTPAPPPAAPAPGDKPADKGADKSDAPAERAFVCFTAREANDRIARLRLYNPLVAMQLNARRLRAEPLRSRLCRSGGQLVYEMSLIRRDGKVLRIFLNAQTGRPIASPRN